MLRRLLLRVATAMQADVEVVRFLIVPAAWLVFLGSPVYWCLWHVLLPSESDSVFLRFTSSLAAVPALFYRRWPPRFEWVFPWYWHFAVLYVAPFTFTFLVLENDFSNLWLISHLGILLLLMEVVPNIWVNLSIMAVGTLLGALAWYALNGPPHWASLPSYYPPVLIFALGFSLAALHATRRKSQGHELLMTLSGTIAHEVRKPLCQSSQAFDLILGLTRGLEGRMARGDSEARASLDQINRIVQTATKSIERGEVLIGIILRTIREERIDTASFVRLRMSEVVDLALRSYPFSRGQRERVECDMAEDFEIAGDETLLVYVLFNLLQNALAFDQAHPDLRVRIVLSRRRAVNVLTVSDNGPGFAPDRYRDVISSGNGGGLHPGRGLGLPFCKRVVTAMRGRMELNSAPGSGCTFVFTFPLLSG